jgi:hypothetical protein
MATFTPFSIPNTTQSSHNYNTAAYKSYIGFLALGITAAVLWVLVIGTLLFKIYPKASRVQKIKEDKEGKQQDIEMACVRLQEPEKVARVGRVRAE